MATAPLASCVRLQSPRTHHRVFKGLTYSLTLSFSDECFSLFGACLWKDSRKQGTLINSVIWGEGGSAEERQTFLTDVKSFLELLNL